MWVPSVFYLFSSRIYTQLQYLKSTCTPNVTVMNYKDLIMQKNNNNDNKEAWGVSNRHTNPFAWLLSCRELQIIQKLIKSYNFFIFLRISRNCKVLTCTWFTKKKIRHFHSISCSCQQSSNSEWSIVKHFQKNDFVCCKHRLKFVFILTKYYEVNDIVQVCLHVQCNNQLYRMLLIILTSVPDEVPWSMEEHASYLLSVVQFVFLLYTNWNIIQHNTFKRYSLQPFTWLITSERH